MHSFVVIALVLLASNVSAAVTGSRLSQLTRRQSGTPALPDLGECSDSCNPISQAIQACVQSNTDPNGNATAEAQNAQGCSCSDDVASKYQACFSCAAANNGLSQAAAQQAMQAYAHGCELENHPLSSVPTIGGGSNSTSSAASGGASATGSSGSSATATPSSGGSSGNGASPLGALHAVVVAAAISGVASIFIAA